MKKSESCKLFHEKIVQPEKKFVQAPTRLKINFYLCSDNVPIFLTNMKTFLLSILFVCCCLCGRAQTWTKAEVDKMKAQVEPYLQKVEAQPDWLFSRLQMYWSTHATDVFINGETFDHPGGGRAPVATVKYNGTRGTASSYNRPALESVVPYDDDESGNVTYINRTSGTMEKAHPSKTGCNIASLNRQILGIACTAAKLFRATGDERYARLALPVFDTFMKGLYYRHVPQDLNHGHQQTLVGMTTFEVIHEDAVNETTDIYRYLGSYIRQDRDIYDAALKKWAENIIAGGVPHNNWDLYQAELIAKIALVLDNDTAYSDGHGRSYYLDYIVNQSSIRQWSLKRLAGFGFGRAFADAGTTQPAGTTWYECPGYSCGVINDFAAIANRLDRDADIDLFCQIPAIKEALFTSAQYLMPNRMIAGFGDTHPNYLNTAGVDNLREYALRHRFLALMDSCDRWKAAVSPQATPADIAPYVSPVFYAPNVSWLAQRSGMDARHDLMISTNASLGNHQHANGISAEFYGKGYVLAPDAGIGMHLYSGLDYAEYYSQFPAHNTVCVDGISTYAVMMSHHAFRVLETASDSARETTSTTVAFTEPETDAQQMRTSGIVKTSATGGYYIDIFRSRRRDGQDKTHDYFYHNLGQSMTLTAADGTDLGLQPTDELAFAGGHLYAYSYLYNKESATTASDICATFTTQCADGRRIDMRLWMQGAECRDVFRALSPANLEYERMPNQPYPISEQPVLTYIARQHGEAWTHPFVAILEPGDSDEPGDIATVSYFRPESRDPSAVGICVTLKSGRKDYIFSSASGRRMRYGHMKAQGYCTVITEE